MKLTVQPIRFDKKERTKCEQAVNLRSRCGAKAEYLFTFNRNAGEGDWAYCLEHCRITVEAAMSLMAESYGTWEDK